MTFTIINDGILPGKISYSREEYAFSTEPYPPFWNSVLVDNLEILLDIDGRVTGVCGLCPHTCWKISELVLPESNHGGVICEKFPTFDSRIPVGIASNWNVYFDPSNGWTRIGDVGENCENIEVVAGLVMSIGHCVLQSIWINIGTFKTGE
ncbi:MAG: hypothetical protein FWG50_06595 [Kiritimatiellaeota bacterium]|nr:hypothetical protein [Kiritimatiellota bacterium]